MNKLSPSSNGSKLEASHNVPQLISNIIEKRKQHQCRIKNIELLPSQILDYTTDVLVYGGLEVDTTGYYSISNQCCIKVKAPTDIQVLQYGICQEDFSDFGCCLTSTLVNSTGNTNNILSNNLSTFLKLDKDKKYIVWLNAVSTDNKQLEYLEDYSHLRLIKV